VDQPNQEYPIMFKYTLPALFAIGLAGTGTATAQTFEEADADGDGVISAEEAAAWGIDIAEADQTGDGVLSRDEFEAYLGGMTGGDADETLD